MSLISLNGGGVFSNDTFEYIASPSNLFIFQDDKGISLIDVESSTATLIHSVNGNFITGIFI